ncbi:hypothetical protein DI487_02765 [Flavobacterium sediminis]|uniref:Peptidylprolyl isomerase n=1 Tax=Flavobacterium sediminis TaxID=2201181 RepID=A0A2U8QSS3_9FLAO|nr:hypothetical protein [Flavobacterium sediminis]AWM12895.1 hypothetical protein DI487_02765 [Flavobacterium sediminis]
MKKILLLFVLFLGFSINASAQEINIEKGLNRTEMLKGVEEVATFLKIDANLKNAFTQLVDMRLEALSNAATTEEKKKINEKFNRKVLSGLTEAQRVQLKNNKAMYKKVIVE